MSAPAQELSQHPYSELRSLIVHGRLAPGARLVEKEIAERLAVSRTPVRSALQRLVQEGYASALSWPGRQPRLVVSPLTRGDACELFALLACLEGIAGREAALLPAELRRPLVVRLRELNDELHTLEPSDLSARFDNDTVFHQTYVDAAAGQRVRAVHASVKPQAERYIRFYISLIGGASGASGREHDAIIKAIASGDGDRADHAVQTNWREAAKRLIAVIDTTGSRGDWLSGKMPASRPARQGL